jgi:transketolase
MRKQFVNTIKEIIKKNKKLFIVLCDIGVFGFREIFQKFNKQIINIGILEQSTISFSAGLSKCGFIPVVHTIAPFLVERALEQIKIDYGYQKLRGNLVSVGGSYDYSSLGCTHHCPGDINILKSIPEIEIIVPGCSREFDKLFKLLYSNKKLTYFRLKFRSASSLSSSLYFSNNSYNF